MRKGINLSVSALKIHGVKRKSASGLLIGVGGNPW